MDGFGGRIVREVMVLIGQLVKGATEVPFFGCRFLGVDADFDFETSYNEENDPQHFRADSAAVLEILIGV